MLDPRQLPTPALTHYIVEHHHEYVRSALPTVISLATKVWRVHGDRQPALASLVLSLHELEYLLMPHIDDEAVLIFPLLESDAPDPDAVARLLATMKEEHVTVADQLSTIRSATDDYAIPTWACSTYRRLFADLSTLESELQRHVHLENDILAPRFIS